MNTHFFAHAGHHLMGDIATSPIEQRCVTLAALLFLAGKSPQRQAQARRRARLRQALPAHRIAAHSGSSNCGF